VHGSTGALPFLNYRHLPGQRLQANRFRRVSGMWATLLSFAAIGVLPFVPIGLPVAPTDVKIGHQVVELLKPLVARSPGARLILYVRDISDLGVARRNILQEFESAVPRGSVVAYLTSERGEMLTLKHTEYSYYHGYAGLVLSETTAPARMELYRHLEIEAKVPLKGVYFVWLDRGGRRVEDVQPAL
jgi:hypothetical protein